jgi:hypothetical protein
MILEIEYKTIYILLYISKHKTTRTWYNAERQDNFTTASEQGQRDAEGSGYRFVRVEGYINRNTSLPPR